MVSQTHASRIKLIAFHIDGVMTGGGQGKLEGLFAAHFAQQ